MWVNCPLKMFCSTVWTPFLPVWLSLCVWTHLTDPWRKHDWRKHWLTPFPFPFHLCGCMSLPLTLLHFLSPTIPLAPFICHISTNISLWCVPPSLALPQYLWRPVLLAQGGKFFMWKQARSSWGGIRSQVLGSSCRGVSLPLKPCLLPQSSALLSPTARLRGNALRHLTSKQIS